MTSDTRTIKIRMNPHPWQIIRIDDILESMRRIHNATVKHYRPVLEQLKNNPLYEQALDEYHIAVKKLDKDSDDEEAKGQKQEAQKTIQKLIDSYKLREQDIQAFANDLRNRSYQKQLRSNIVQKEASRIYKGISKIIWGNGRELSYKKKGQLNTFEEKKATCGIIYDAKTNSVKVLGMRIDLENPKKGDKFLQRELEAIKYGRSKISYCRVKREPVGKNYKYELQIVVKGKSAQPAKKHGDGRVFIDPGMSCMACYGKDEAYFFLLAEDVSKYNEEIAEASRRYDRLLREANPDNFKEDGTVKRDTKTFHKKWTRTPAMLEAVIIIKDAYRRRTAYINRTHAEKANLLVSKYSTVVVEKMDYASMMKKAKKLPDVDDETVEIIDRLSDVAAGDVEMEEIVEEIHATADKVEDKISGLSKNKSRKRRRFGRSINMRAPASFLACLKEKVVGAGGSYIEVPCQLFALSQLVHTTGEKVKMKLSERVKTIEVDGVEHLVQRDLYSAFLGYHIVFDNAAKPDSVDLMACSADFEDFLACQKRVIKELSEKGDPTGNFGLSSFLNE